MPTTISMRYRTSTYDGQHRLEVEITTVSGELSTTALFLMHQIPNWYGATSVAQPLGVCSALDIANYPENAPLANANPPYFRAATIDLLLDSTATVASVVASITAALDRLRLSVDRLASLGSWQSVAIGS